MAYEFRTERTVEFAETDTAGIVHFSYFFRYMEECEHAFYRSLGFSVCPPPEEKHYGWPRIGAECRFSRPLRFEDTAEVHLLVRSRNDKTIDYDFILRKLNADPVEEVARGSLSVICITREERGGPMKAAAIPEEIAALIEAAPKELLD